MNIREGDRLVTDCGGDTAEVLAVLKGTAIQVQWLPGSQHYPAGKLDFLERPLNWLRVSR